jgi:hypothetical protein
MKSGQWATFAASTRSNSAYQLYRTLLSKLSSELSPEQVAQWPVMFRGEQGLLTVNKSKMRYQEFLNLFSLDKPYHIISKQKWLS